MPGGGKKTEGLFTPGRRRAYRYKSPDELPDTCSAFLEGRIEIAIAGVKEYLKLNSPLGKTRAEWHVPVHRRETARGIEAFIRERKGVMIPGAVLPDEVGLHTMRKAMKDILYVWPCFSKGDILLLPEKWRSLDNLHSCTGLLGEFYDICIRLQLLQDDHFLLTADGQAGAFLEEVRQLWRKDREEKLEQLRHLLLPAGEAGKENPFAPRDLKAASYELHVD